MRMRLEHDGTVFEFERKPIPERRFKAPCAIVAAGIYAGMVTAVAALCGGFGLLMVMACTIMVLIIVKGLE